jgi:hypothetical protein
MAFCHFDASGREHRGVELLLLGTARKCQSCCVGTPRTSHEFDFRSPILLLLRARCPAASALPTPAPRRPLHGGAGCRRSNQLIPAACCPQRILRQGLDLHACLLELFIALGRKPGAEFIVGLLRGVTLCACPVRPLDERFRGSSPSLAVALAWRIRRGTSPQPTGINTIRSVVS